MFFYHDTFPSAYYILSCICETVTNNLGTSLVSTLESVGGPALENAIARLGIAEYQENKLNHFLAGRVDESNPVALSKRSSTYTFERGGREYRIRIDVETYDTKDKSITRSFRNAIQSPAFIITSTLCSATIRLLAFVSPYWSSTILGGLSDGELETLGSEYFLLLDRCAILLNDDWPNP